MTTDIARHIYDTRQWKRIRLYVLERDGYTCDICRAPGNIVDHDPPITDLIAAGLDPYDPAHMRVLCARCSGKVDGPRSCDWIPSSADVPSVNPFDRWL